jgi:methylglutaconyl-CoA hydratase
MFDRLNTMPMPTIARVQGAAFAGALGLICACDIAVGAEHAVFAVSEVRLGIVAAVISPYVIAAIGPAHARRYFQTAERIDAAEAQRIGLLHETASAETLDSVVEDIVGNILENAPASLAACKTLIREAAGPDSDALRESVAELAAATRATDEAQEGIASFFEKRKPSWALGKGSAS